MTKNFQLRCELFYHQPVPWNKERVLLSSAASHSTWEQMCFLYVFPSFMDGPVEPVSLQPARKANIPVQGPTVSTNAAFSKGNFSSCGKKVKMDEQG